MFCFEFLCLIVQVLMFHIESQGYIFLHLDTHKKVVFYICILMAKINTIKGSVNHKVIVMYCFLFKSDVIHIRYCDFINAGVEHLLLINHGT